MSETLAEEFDRLIKEYDSASGSLALGGRSKQRTDQRILVIANLV